MRYKVIIVDDEIFVRAWLKKCIDWEKCGYSEVFEASNGMEALDILEKENIDLVLTDLRMPVLSGTELIRKIREKDSRIRVIILTCLDDFDYVKQAFELDVTNYILKLTSEVDEIEKELIHAKEQLENIDKYQFRKPPEQSSIPENNSQPDVPGGSKVRLHAAMEFLQKHYSENINLSSVADEVGVTPNYLGRKFFQEYGLTFNDKINRLRIEKAKQMLKEPSCRINEIAEKVGYVSASYFFRIFRKYEGCTPTEYRSRNGLE